MQESRSPELLRRLTWRLLLPLLVLISVMLLAFGAFTASDQASFVTRSLSARAQYLAKTLAVTTMPLLLTRDIEGLEAQLTEQLQDGRSLALQVIDGAGTLVVDVELVDRKPVARFGRVAPALPAGAGESRLENVSTVRLLGASFDRHSGHPVAWHRVGTGDFPIGWVRVIVDASPIRKVQRDIWRFNLALVLSVLLVTAAAVYLTLRRPLLELRRAADFAGSIDLSVGRQVPGCDSIIEVDQLFNALNRMSAGLAAHEAMHAQAARAMQESREAAESANRTKTNFLANISHELRTPMNGILGMAELALRAELVPRQRRQIEVIRESGKRLMVLINDLIDFSGLESGKIALDAREFDLTASLDALQQEIEPMAAAKGLRFVCELSDDAPRRVVGDAGRLTQLLRIYCDNAVKFTGHGEIHVSVRLDARCRDDVRLRFSVRDTGAGVDAETRARLFKGFEQADATSTRQHGGTGIGLAIARGLAALMDGEVGVESAPGAGSTFWFTARLGVPAANAG